MSSVGENMVWVIKNMSSVGDGAMEQVVGVIDEEDEGLSWEV